MNNLIMNDYFSVYDDKLTRKHIQYLELIVIHFAQHNTKCYESYKLLTNFQPFYTVFEKS